MCIYYWFLNNKIISDEEGWATKPLIVGLRKSEKKNKLVLPNTKKKSPDRNEGYNIVKVVIRPIILPTLNIYKKYIAVQIIEIIFFKNYTYTTIRHIFCSIFVNILYITN